jgi:hypothetical protein
VPAVTGLVRTERARLPEHDRDKRLPGWRA